MYTTTLLYNQDYSRFSGIIDYKTSNLSFLRMVKILKELNVKNRYFFLYLSQPELQGVDPYDPSLDDNTKYKIGYECCINPWYYFREVVRIPVQGSVHGIHFKLHRANLALLWCFFNDIQTFITIPRQNGKTMSTQALMSYVMFIRGRHLSLTMFTKDNQLRAENVEKLRDIRDSLPPYLINKHNRKEKDNTWTLEYREFENMYNTYVAQDNVINAEKIGRGSTVPIVHIDEIVLFNNIHITYPSAMNAMINAYKNAKKQHQPRGIVITSTAGNLDTKPGKFSYGLVNESYRFTESLYDIENRDSLIKLISKSSLSKRIYIEHSFLQLGNSKEELAEAIIRSRTEGSDELQVLRDLFNIWTRGSVSTPFDKEILQSIKTSEKEPEFIEFIDEFTFYWYYPEDKIKGSWFKSTPIILGVDPAENIGKDFTALVFINALNGEVIGTMKCNENNVIKIAVLLFNILYNNRNILLIIERNSTGCVIIDKLLIDFQDVGINPLERIFNWFVHDEGSIDISDLSDAKRAKIGFRTTKSVSKGRNYLFNVVLTKALRLSYNKIYDKGIINETYGLKRDKNGRINHEEGEHDDSVFAYMLANYVLFYGKNLDKYSFLSSTNKTEVLSQVDNVKFKGGVDIEDQYYNSIADKIFQLKMKIKRTDNQLIKTKLQAKVKELMSILPKKYHDKIDDEQVLRIDSKNKITMENKNAQLSKFFNEVQEIHGNIDNPNKLRELLFFGV